MLDKRKYCFAFIAFFIAAVLLAIGFEFWFAAEPSEITVPVLIAGSLFVVIALIVIMGFWRFLILASEILAVLHLVNIASETDSLLMLYVVNGFLALIFILDSFILIKRPKK